MKILCLTRFTGMPISSMPIASDAHIARASGKMETLVRLLRRLKAKDHRVVLFSQFTRFMDIVDDFLNMSGYSYVRLDGSTNRVQRMVVS